MGAVFIVFFFAVVFMQLSSKPVMARVTGVNNCSTVCEYQKVLTDGIDVPKITTVPVVL
jgi:hypothetical protein